MENFVSQISERVFKAHPYVFMFVVIVAALLLGYSYKVFAEKVDVEASLTSMQEKLDNSTNGITDEIEAIKTDIRNLNTKIDRSFLEQQLGDMEREIYSLERIVGTPEGNARDSDRLDQIRIDRSELVRELGRLPAESN